MVNRRPVMLVGNAGSGKTVLINNKLSSLDGDETLVTTIPLNYYTNSMMLQQVIILSFMSTWTLKIILCLGYILDINIAYHVLYYIS